MRVRRRVLNISEMIVRTGEGRRTEPRQGSICWKNCSTFEKKKKKNNWLAGVLARFLSHPFTPSLICVSWNVIGVTWRARWNVPFDLLHRSIWLRTHKGVWKGQAQILDGTGLDLRLSHLGRPLRCDNAGSSSIV